MNIRNASALIAQHLDDGSISREAAIRAQSAIRGDYYGSRMSGEDRRRMLALRFGIVDTASPVNALLARASMQVA